jgi:myo-inositol-1(or 4)-monophosphatase
MNQFLDTAIEAAREAGAIILSGHARPKEITYKGDVDLVTETDRRSEAAIVARLRRDFPEHTIVAEEGSGKDGPASPFVWYVDPLDGTTNFAHGYPCFAASIGLLENGKPVVGVVFNPVTNELFHASAGDGAFLNQKPIHVSSVDRLGASLVSTGFPVHKRSDNLNIHYYWQFTLRSHGVRRDGAASLDLCSVASGRFDAFWEFGLRSWDTAAGMLIVTEAGGRVSDLSGAPYRPGGTSILATNGLVHDEVQRVAAEIAARPPKF